MAYQSLYRKYRSKDFGDLVGQRHITKTLANAIATGRVSHAYLFCGPRGTGKTSTARVLAKALNCMNGPTAEPCDTCAYCQSIRQGTAMDVVEIDAASNRNIDDIRQLREQVNYPPVELRYKFYIVDEVHQLTRDSFNAFLKTLEEPPAHVIFVLCTTDPHQLPATILSRCQRFDFHRITLDDIVERLRWIVGQEGWTAEDEALFLLARAANGGLRDALSLLDQAASYAGPAISAQHVRDILGGIDLELLLNVSDSILKHDAPGLFRLIDHILADGKDVPQLVSELILHWRNLLRVHIGGADSLVEFSTGQREQMAQQARLTTQAAIMQAITLWCEAENELRWNSQQRILLELYSLRIMNPATAAPVAAQPVSTPTVAPTPKIARPEPRPTVAPAQGTRPATPAPAAVTPSASPTPAPGVAAEADWTLPKLKASWPQFLDWLGRSANGLKLRGRIVEKCWPHSVTANRLVLATASGFVCSQVTDPQRTQVKTALEQCLHTFFHTPFLVDMHVAGAAVETPQPPIASAPPSPGPVPVIAEAPAAPPQDIVGERITQMFHGSTEIT